VASIIRCHPSATQTDSERRRDPCETSAQVTHSWLFCNPGQFFNLNPRTIFKRLCLNECQPIRAGRALLPEIGEAITPAEGHQFDWSPAFEYKLTRRATKAARKS
jgi:hypothetical protein